jgi:hypothetical protein
MLTRAPFQGPSSSFSLNQNGLAVHAGLLDLTSVLSRAETVSNPDDTTIFIPTLPTTLNLGLPGGNLYLGDGVGRIAAMTMPLNPYTDTYIDAIIGGTGSISDFGPNDLIFQGAGSYINQYAITTGTCISSSPVNIGSGVTFSQVYNGSFFGAGGWGPACLDQSGNGFIVRIANGGGALYSASNNLPIGQALALIGYNQASGPGHQLRLDITYLGTNVNTFSYKLVLYVDSMNEPLMTYTTTSATINPDSIYPAFISDGGEVFLTDWKWSNQDNSPVLTWTKTSVPNGTTAPKILGRRCYVVSTSTVPIGIIPQYDLTRLSNRVASLKEKINLLQRAYF